MRRLARITGTLMIIAGIGALAWSLTVWQWQDPFTAATNRLEQRQLAQSLEDSFKRYNSSAQPATGTTSRSSLARDGAAWRRRVARGEAVGRLRVPRLDLDTVIVNGTDDRSLKRGPGRYLGSKAPGEGELVYVAGHRTTHGAPFSRIDRLRRGDSVLIEVPYGVFEYRVTGFRIVPATRTSELRSRGFEQLVLQACHPRFFASERYIVYAKPVRVTPRAGRPLLFAALGR